MCYVPIKNIEFVNCIINCSSPIIFKIRNDNKSGEDNTVVNMNVKYNNCEITVSDFDDTNMRTFMFFTYTWNEQAEDYDYALPIANTVDCTVNLNYGNVKITDDAYAGLNNEFTLSELPHGSTVKYAPGTTEHGLEYLKKQWGSNASYIERNVLQETPFWIQIGEIVGKGGSITRNTSLKYPANIRYNINSDDFSESTALTTLAGSTLNTGDKVYFWGDLNTVAESSSSSYGSLIKFSFSSNNVSGHPFGSVLNDGFKTVAIGGNLMSLYYMDSFGSHDTVDPNRNSSTFYKIDGTWIRHWLTDASKFYICPNLSYKSYFEGHYALVSPPDFSHITSVNLTSQFNSMFSGCTALAECPDLSNITNVREYDSLREMFKGCTSLVTAILPKSLTNVPGLAMYGMFKGCTSLQDTTYMEITGFSYSGSMMEMFNDCTNLETSNIFINYPYATFSGGIEKVPMCYKHNFSYDSTNNKVKFSPIGTTTSTEDAFSCMYLNCKKLKNLTYPINIQYEKKSGSGANIFFTGLRGMFAGSGVEEVTINAKKHGETTSFVSQEDLLTHMFYYSDIKRFTLNLVDYTDYTIKNGVTTGLMFGNTPNLEYVNIAHIKKLFNDLTSFMDTATVPETGTIIVSNDDGISAGTNGIPEGWTVEYALN